MPLIKVSCSKITEPEKKEELIKKLTMAASEVMGIAPSSYTVYIEEYERENIGVGGKSLSAKDKGN